MQAGLSLPESVETKSTKPAAAESARAYSLFEMFDRYWLGLIFTGIES